jgi:hypothetical protein
MNNAAIIVTFEHSILSVRFLENAIISLEDVKELYAYGNMWAHGNPYCVLFEAVAHYEVSEDAVEYFSLDNPSDTNILAKAYVIADNKEAQLKSKMHLLFDQPKIEPNVFRNHEDARKYLDAAIKLYNAK